VIEQCFHKSTTIIVTGAQKQQDRDCYHGFLSAFTHAYSPVHHSMFSVGGGRQSPVRD
jgi:hypothetical protein